MKVKQGSFATQSSFLGKEISPFIAVTFAVGKIKPEKKKYFRLVRGSNP